MNDLQIVDTNATSIQNFGFCGYKNIKQEGYRRKLDWLKQKFAEGMKFKVLQSESGGAVGFIEYIPGEYAWRAVDAKGYMVIHCIANFYRQHREQGYGTLLIEESIADARKSNMPGVAVVTRKGTWMAGKELFLRNGFEVVDTAPPDFELLVKKIASAPFSNFPKDWDQRLSRYGPGLTIIQSDQCPYTAKAVNEISATAEAEYDIKPEVVELKNSRDAQNAPSAFAVFGIVYNGKLVADHPISNTRFKNIMNKEAR
jgi:N-acetylglutamate synthase-like GNAT family acetyltransferase